jgi:hypothetical protein
MVSKMFNRPHGSLLDAIGQKNLALRAIIPKSGDSVATFSSHLKSNPKGFASEKSIAMQIILKQSLISLDKGDGRKQMDSQIYNSIVSFIWGIADDCSPQPPCSSKRKRARATKGL